VDDALKWLATYKEEKRQFDVIFGDLTDIPVHGGDTSTWAFVRGVVRTSLLLLPVGGKYYTHINGVNSPKAIALFGEMVKELGVPVEISTSEAHVPSFMEKWVFYQITRIEGEVKDAAGGEEVAEVNGVEPEAKKEDPKAEEPKESDKKEEEKSEPVKEEKKEIKDEKKKNPSEKKDEKKVGGAKTTKESLETPKEKGLTKEKSNVDKKGGAKKAK